MNKIEKDDLVKGGIYVVQARMFNIAMWTGEMFRGPAVMYGKLVFWEEGHYSDGLPFGTCTPLRWLNRATVKTFEGASLLAALAATDELAYEEVTRLRTSDPNFGDAAE